MTQTKREEIRAALLLIMEPLPNRNGWATSSDLSDKLGGNGLEATAREVLHAMRALASEGRCKVQRKRGRYEFLRLTLKEEERRVRREEHARLARAVVDKLTAKGVSCRCDPRSPGSIIILVRDFVVLYPEWSE